jgi:DNA-binding transcriptional LysR family regulator
VFAAPTYRSRWAFARGNEHEEIEVRGNLRSDNGLVLFSAAMNGLGVYIAHNWMVRGMLEEGRMRRVLADYTVNPRPGDAELYAVYASSRGLSRRVRVFIDFLVEAFADATRSASTRS